MPGEPVPPEMFRVVLDHPLEFVFVKAGHPGAPRPPAPRPCFLPRPWVRLPRNLRVLETIFALLEEHPHEERVDRASAVSEVPSVVESALNPAIPFPRRRQSEDGPELAHIGEGRLAFRDRLAQVPDRLVLAVARHARIVDRLVADLAASLQEELGEDFWVDFAPGDVVLHELEHASERRVLRYDRAMVLAGQVQHAERVLHVPSEIAFPSDPQDGEAHSSGASSSFGSAAGSSVRASPSTSISSGSSPGGADSATTGGASTFRVKTCSAPALILRRSVCSDRTLT